MSTNLDLSKEQVAALLPHSPGFCEVPEEAEQFYGRPLSSVMGAGGAWLEDAIVAGYVPDLASIGLALRASQALAIDEVRYARGHPEDGSGSREVMVDYRDRYRGLVELLEGFVGEFKHQP